MGVLTSEENIPLIQVVFPRNKHDKEVFEDALPTLLSLVEEVTDDPEDIIFVFDRGCNDEDLIRTIERTSHCVGKLKRDQDPAELLRTPVGDLDHLYTTEKDHEVRGSTKKGEVFGESRPIAIMWHEGKAKKKRKRLERLKDGALKTCRDLKERVGKGGRGRKFTADGVHRRLESFDEVSEAFDWNFDEKGQSFSWRFNEDEWNQILERGGKSLLFTSYEDWSAEQIVRAYGGKWRVERSFRLMKGPVPARPIYHWEKNRIREHLFLIFLLLVIHRFLMEKIRKPVLEEFEVGEETIHRLLRELHLITGKLSESDKPDFSVEDQGAIEKSIFEELELERFVPETK